MRSVDTIKQAEEKERKNYVANKYKLIQLLFNAK